MTKIKLCGLMRPCDVAWANELEPDYIGFVLVPGRRRYISPEKAAELKALLRPQIKAVGVFINESAEEVARLLAEGTIDVAQLHGSEDEDYIRTLRTMTDKPVFKAFRIETEEDVQRANRSSADMVLLDSGIGGTGEVFDWQLLQGIARPYFLAGGLQPDNIGRALSVLTPFGVDVSSGIETDGLKDQTKMAAFVAEIRKEDAI